MKKNSSIVIALCFIFQATACKPQRTTKDEGNKYITDSISPYDNRILKYGNDSIYAFSLDSIIDYILYQDTALPIKRILFENGRKSFVEYNPYHSKHSILSESFFLDSEQVSSKTFLKDSFIVYRNDSVLCNRLIIEYYKSGVVNSIKYQGFLEGQGVPVGTHQIYNELGELIKTEHYVYLRDQIQSYLTTYIEESEYYTNGLLRWSKFYENYTFSESDFPPQAIGTWRYYDETGKLTKKEKHSDFIP